MDRLSYHRSRATLNQAITEPDEDTHIKLPHNRAASPLNQISITSPYTSIFTPRLQLNNKDLNKLHEIIQENESLKSKVKEMQAEIEKVRQETDKQIEQAIAEVKQTR